MIHTIPVKVILETLNRNFRHSKYEKRLKLQRLKLGFSILVGCVGNVGRE